MSRLRLLGALAAALALPALAAPAAFAHATLIGSSPSAQAVLARAPSRVVLRFDQPVRPVASGSDVVDAAGRSVTTGPPRPSPADARAVVLPLRSGLADGDYTVRWRIVSADGHIISGVVAFGVGSGRAPPQATAAEQSTLDPAYLAARLAFFAGLLLAVGGAAFRLLVLAPARATLGAGDLERFSRREQDRSTAVLAGAAVLMLVGGWVALTIQASEVAGSSFWAAFDHDGPIGSAIEATRFGRVFGRGLDIMAVAAVAFLVLRPLLRRYPMLARAAWVAAVPLCALAVTVPGLSGHAGDPGKGLLAVAVDALHVAAAAVWVGGLAQLFAVVPHATAALPEGPRRAARLAAAQRFSTVALIAVAVVGASGVGRALWEVGAPAELWTTGYGRALVVKTALLALAVALGYRNRGALADFRGLRRRVGVELAVMLALVAAVSVLTDLPPATTAAAGAAPRPAPAAGGAARVALGHGTSLAVWPGRAGANVVAVQVPGRARRALLLVGSRTLPLRPAGRGAFAAVVPGLRRGRAALQVAVGTRTYAASVEIGPRSRTPVTPAAPKGTRPVAAGRAGDVAVGLQRLGGGRLQVTLIDRSGASIADALVRVDGRLALPCKGKAARCYLARVPSGAVTPAVAVERPGRAVVTASVALPAADAPPAGRLLRTVARRFSGLNSLRAENDLSSGGATSVHTTFVENAPDRVFWRVRGGAQAVIIGHRRWDRNRAGAPWKRSPAVPVRVPDAFWARGATAVHVADEHGRTLVLTLVEPSGPTFFRLWIRRPHRILRLQMVTAAHFMHERELDQNTAARVRPPVSR